MEYINTSDSSRTRRVKENHPKQFTMSSHWCRNKDHRDIKTK